MLKIKDIRKENNYTQKDLAVFLNKSIATICDWERGRTEPSIEDLIQLTKIFKCSVDYIIGNSSEEDIIVINDKLNETENYFLNLLRQLNIEKKQELINYANYLANKDSRQINTNNTLDISNLSDLEKAEVIGFIDGFKKRAIVSQNNVQKDKKWS